MGGSKIKYLLPLVLIFLMFYLFLFPFSATFSCMYIFFFYSSAPSPFLVVGGEGAGGTYIPRSEPLWKHVQVPEEGSG